MKVNKPRIESRNGLKSYMSPQLTEYGEVAKLTAGQSTGSVLDATFPTGTMFDDLTFS